MEITELNPKIVWKYFHEITQVPRPSKKEGKIIAYLEKFAKEHGIEYKKDHVGNIVMIKPATPGYEDRVKVILQSHVDMVCEKNAGTQHDEETGMTGAFELKPGFLTGKILINLDSEDEGELFIGCAGGKGLEATFSPQWQPAPAGLVWLRAAVSGLKGGHSGGEIHCGLGNANKILTRYLYSLERELGSWSLAEIAGGNLPNAIPREAHARLELTEAAAPSQVVDDKTKYGLVRSLYACPHGVLGMSHEMEDLVETSNNLASIKQRDGKIVVTTSQRSSTTSLRDSASEMVASAFELGGAQVALTDAYPGWKPNPESAILKASADAYRKLFGKEAAVKAIHAGLECGLILDVYPDLDMVSFGPTLRDVHSPAERIEIKTVDLWWRHLLEVLKEIPADK